MDLKLYVRAQRDRVAAIVLIVLGGLALLIGWIGVSGNALVYKQLAYVVSGGLFGIALVGIGTTLWLSAALTDEWRKLDRIDEALRGRAPDDPGPVLDEQVPGHGGVPVQLDTLHHHGTAHDEIGDDEIGHDDSAVTRRPRPARRASPTRSRG